MNRFATLAAAACAAALVLAPAATASTKNLWATVNVCDTARHPDKMGVRARMPGDGARERMYMRFTAEFRKGASWRIVKGGVSKWLFTGSALFRFEELGYDFAFDPPAEGQAYLMRGLVQFQWRKRVKGRWRVAHQTHALTEAGHRSQGADPRGYSAATCRIRG